MSAVSFDAALGALCPAIGAYFAIRDGGCAGLVFSHDCWTAIIGQLDPRRRHCADALVAQFDMTIGRIRRGEITWDNVLVGNKRHSMFAAKCIRDQLFVWTPGYLWLVNIVGGEYVKVMREDNYDHPTKCDCKCSGPHVGICSGWSIEAVYSGYYKEIHALPCGVRLCRSRPPGKFYMTDGVRFIEIPALDRDMLYSDFGEAVPVPREVMVFSSTTQVIPYFNTNGSFETTMYGFLQW